MDNRGVKTSRSSRRSYCESCDEFDDSRWDRYSTLSNTDLRNMKFESKIPKCCMNFLEHHFKNHRPCVPRDRRYRSSSGFRPKNIAICLTFINGCEPQLQKFHRSRSMCARSISDKQSFDNRDRKQSKDKKKISFSLNKQFISPERDNDQTDDEREIIGNFGIVNEPIKSKKTRSSSRKRRENDVETKMKQKFSITRTVRSNSDLTQQQQNQYEGQQFAIEEINDKKSLPKTLRPIGFIQQNFESEEVEQIEGEKKRSSHKSRRTERSKHEAAMKQREEEFIEQIESDTKRSKKSGQPKTKPNIELVNQDVEESADDENPMTELLKSKQIKAESKKEEELLKKSQYRLKADTIFDGKSVATQGLDYKKPPREQVESSEDGDDEDDDEEDFAESTKLTSMIIDFDEQTASTPKSSAKMIQSHHLKNSKKTVPLFQVSKNLSKIPQENQQTELENIMKSANKKKSNKEKSIKKHRGMPPLEISTDSDTDSLNYTHKTPYETLSESKIGTLQNGISVVTGTTATGVKKVRNKKNDQFKSKDYKFVMNEKEEDAADTNLISKDINAKHSSAKRKDSQSRRDNHSNSHSSVRAQEYILNYSSIGENRSSKNKHSERKDSKLEKNRLNETEEWKSEIVNVSSKPPQPKSSRKPTADDKQNELTNEENVRSNKNSQPSKSSRTPSVKPELKVDEENRSRQSEKSGGSTKKDSQEDKNKKLSPADSNEEQKKSENKSETAGATLKVDESDKLSKNSEKSTKSEQETNLNRSKTEENSNKSKISEKTKANSKDKTSDNVNKSKGSKNSAEKTKASSTLEVTKDAKKQSDDERASKNENKTKTSKFSGKIKPIVIKSDESEDEVSIENKSKKSKASEKSSAVNDSNYLSPNISKTGKKSDSSKKSQETNSSKLEPDKKIEGSNRSMHEKNSVSVKNSEEKTSKNNETKSKNSEKIVEKSVKKTKRTNDEKESTINTTKSSRHNSEFDSDVSKASNDHAQHTNVTNKDEHQSSDDDIDDDTIAGKSLCGSELTIEKKKDESLEESDDEESPSYTMPKGKSSSENEVTKKNSSFNGTKRSSNLSEED